MNIEISALGAVAGLVIAIALIFLKVPSVYSLMLGALCGGLIGGASLSQTVNLMVDGAGGMIGSILRILAAGCLSGVLIKSGAAEVIADRIVQVLGKTRALLAVILATLLLTSVGVFIDIAVITVAPIALMIARETHTSRTGILVAMIGGGKAGNIMSPNPNTIALSSAFDIPLTSLMLAGVIPAVFAVLVTYLLARQASHRGSAITEDDFKGKDNTTTDESSPSFLAAISGPLTAIILLALRPIAHIEIDPMIALPIGGIVGCLAMGKGRRLLEYINYGLSQMVDVAIILIGTGTLAGIIQHSTLGNVLTSTLQSTGLPLYLLAPIAGILMGGAAASTTSGSIIASQVFGPTLTNAGISPIASAAMIHAGATVIDSLPHGSFFHATAGAVNMEFKERLSVIGYEALIGLTSTVVATILYGVLHVAG